MRRPHSERLSSLEQGFPEINVQESKVLIFSRLLGGYTFSRFSSVPSFLYRFQHLVSAQSLIWILEGSSVSTLQGPGGAHGSVEQSQNFENSGWPEWWLHFEGILAGCRRASAKCDEQNRPKPLALFSWCSMCLMPVWHDTMQTVSKPLQLAERWEELCLLWGIGRGTQAELDPDRPEFEDE